MDDEHTVAYCKNLVTTNLKQYINDKPELICQALRKLDNDENYSELLIHCKSLKSLIDRCIVILESQNDRNK